MTPRRKRVVKRGRPTVYRPEYAQQAYRHCLLGATDVQLAALFDVSVPTIDKWKQSKPEFLQALKDGKERADANIAQSLYRRALGYSHKAVKILTVADGNNTGSHVEQVPYVERYPPDTTAAIFWLKNRAASDWRDRRDVDLTTGGVSLNALLVVPAETP